MDRWTDFVQMHHIDEHTEPRASAVISLGEDVWCIWGQEILPIWPDTWTCSPWRWYMVTTDTAALVDQAIATLRNVTPKYRLSSPWTSLLSEFSDWVGHHDWFDPIFWWWVVYNEAHKLVGLVIFGPVQNSGVFVRVWHLPGSPSGLAACVSDERYGTSGSYYSWEGEVRIGWVFGENFKYLRSWKLMMFDVFFQLYVPQWVLGVQISTQNVSIY